MLGLKKNKKDKDGKRKSEKKEKKGKDKKSVGSSEDVVAPVYSTKAQRTLLVIDSESRDWAPLFSPVQGLKVEQCGWKDMIVQAESNGQALVNFLTATKETKVCQPDFVLVRQLVRGLCEDELYTNALYGLLFAGIPAVNSIDSIHQGLERPAVYAALRGVQKTLGKDKFPLIPMSYYSHAKAMRFTPDFPLVAKIGSAEAGYGKMRFQTSDDFGDFRGVVALHKDYVTLEKLIEDREYDIRVQKVGTHLRAYKRMNSNWKGNVGTCVLEEIEVTDTFREWAEECGKLFGGMDILTVDAIHSKDGKDYILEINDTASGFAPANMEEDMRHVRDLVLQRMHEAYPDD